MYFIKCYRLVTKVHFFTIKTMQFNAFDTMHVYCAVTLTSSADSVHVLWRHSGVHLCHWYWCAVVGIDNQHFVQQSSTNKYIWYRRHFCTGTAQCYWNKLTAVYIGLQLLCTLCHLITMKETYHALILMGGLLRP